ncbi:MULTISPECIES: FadR/GntR family transcriptional regulator [unclassified Arthrobacter]|uniref:FadR/GntR family transcriptional regulator n=1 Tax=unclassified Arthrobacter TaxID=235627 RepID=UPI00159DFA2C|nr:MULTISPECIES: FadR/GntR family transcriptional regulator [unclassified Arthrobacter]MCQ9164506.1 FadR family transcriptional regulator [Arthrobacter sp. STN4]NVM98241.1 FadR family transcriptional regulator [Arthrobacter sp. SDTb3-6]
MARKSLTEVVADDLLDRIVAGEFPPGSLVPGELELGAQHEVSRMTVREAMKTLEAQRILRVERGRGTFVNPLGTWGSLHAVLRAVSEGRDDAAVAIQLIELRRMLETGACELAATRISGDDLKRLAGELERMRTAHAANDVPAFVESDLAFHDIILHASGNIFVSVLFEPLHRILENRRAETSRVPEIQANAIAMHAAILAALTAGRPEPARVAMDNHMVQTLDDLKGYVLQAPKS